MKIGAHISIAGGIDNVPQRAKKIGAECFQIFSRSPRGGVRRKIDLKEVKDFLDNCVKYKFEIGRDYIVHAPYFINLASENNRIYNGSIIAIKEELNFANKIKSSYVVIHIGSSKDLEGSNIEEKINKKVWRALEKIHKGYKGKALLLLEISAGSGNIIGDSINEIAYFIKKSKQVSFNLGFCLDTCHAFAGGYDLRTPTKVQTFFAEIKKEIGLRNMKAIHLNDSMFGLGTHIDRHEHIGKGKIGKAGLREVVRLAENIGINLYLETKYDEVRKDITLVKGFRKSG